MAYLLKCKLGINSVVVPSKYRAFQVCVRAYLKCTQRRILFNVFFVMLNIFDTRPYLFYYDTDKLDTWIMNITKPC